MSTITHNEFGKDTSFGDNIETGTLKLLFEVKNLIKDAWFFRIGLLETEC
jgi:hypothetical protein